jgi:hypothetical protein
MLGRSTWTFQWNRQSSCESTCPLPLGSELVMSHLPPTTSTRKPATALGDPYPAPTIIPKFTAADDCADYESELAIVLSRDCKNVSEADAPSYILGYTAANDVSSRKTQLSTSQWCFSKGFDGACPVGPTIVSPSLIPDVRLLRLKGSKNGTVKQDCGIEYVSTSLATAQSLTTKLTSSLSLTQRSHLLCAQVDQLLVARNDPSGWYCDCHGHAGWCWHGEQGLSEEW